MLSVLTNTWNNETTIRTLYDALCEQTYKNFEWIITDDGSDDKTWSIIQKIQKEDKIPVQSFRQNHEGFRLGKSINQGIKVAQGNEIFVIMGDSYPNPDTLEILSKVYIQGTAGSGIRRNVNPDGSFHSWDWRLSGNNNFIGETLDISKYKNPWSYLTGNSFIVDREVFNSIGNWPEEYKGYGREDWAIFLRLSKIGCPLYMYNSVIINHLYHEGQPDSVDNIKRFEEEYADYIKS